MRRRGMLLACLVFVALALVTAGPGESKNQQGLTVVGWKVKWNADENRYYVVGTAKNNSSKRYAMVQVQFSLYDKKGEWVGEAMDDTTNLGSHSSWQFHARICHKSAKTVRFKAIRGY